MSRPFKLSKRDLARLEGVHPDLVRVVQRVADCGPIPFTVLEGLRSPERQRKLLDQGATSTLNSRHLTGHAVDIAPLDAGEPSWAWPLYHRLAPIVKLSAKDLGVALDWGGDWKHFKDGPHWELRWSRYPLGQIVVGSGADAGMPGVFASLW